MKKWRSWKGYLIANPLFFLAKGGGWLVMCNLIPFELWQEELLLRLFVLVFGSETASQDLHTL